MQQILSEIRSKIQNYSYNFNNVQAISDISVASYFTRGQEFWILADDNFCQKKNNICYSSKSFRQKKMAWKFKNQ